MSRRTASYILSLFLVCLLAACDRQPEAEKTGQVRPLLTVWAHAGQEAERQVLQDQAARFNRQAKDSEIRLTFIPERDYNAQVQAAALAGELPDILEFDGPYVYNYIWQGHLMPLDTLLPQSLRDDLLPSIIDQGTYNRRLYAVGTFDSGLGLYARKTALTAIAARIPAKAGEAWSADEFTAILQKLAARDKDGAVLDLKLNYGGEWFTYGFSPVLQSAGGDLIDRRTYLSSTGVLNSAASIAAMRTVQQWISAGLVDANVDDAAFLSGRVPLSWVGHWEYGRYAAAFGDDLVILPLPDFGRGSRTGQGSWSWGITRNSQYPEKAATFVRFLFKTDEVLAMSNANGAVPGTRRAVQKSALYGDHGRLRLFADQLLGGYSVPRPKTPAYPVITTQFRNAFQQIRNGGDVQQALTFAAEQIDQDILDNQGYPFSAE